MLMKVSVKIWNAPKPGEAAMNDNKPYVLQGPMMPLEVFLLSSLNVKTHWNVCLLPV
jgi:hypothetical protein